VLEFVNSYSKLIKFFYSFLLRFILSLERQASTRVQA